MVTHDGNLPTYDNGYIWSFQVMIVPFYFHYLIFRFLMENKLLVFILC
jgi:hypothetical protein